MKIKGFLYTLLVSFFFIQCNKTKKIELGTKAEFAANWETYPIENLIRDNEDNSGKEADIDATFDIASSFYFVR